MDAENLDDALNGYAQAVVEAWATDGRLLQDLASSVGVAPQFISQVRLSQTRLGIKSVRGFARALGTDIGGLEARALAWHAAGRPALTADVLPSREG